jgi:hypothetical protein
MLRRGVGPTSGKLFQFSDFTEIGMGMHPTHPHSVVTLVQSEGAIATTVNLAESCRYTAHSWVSRPLFNRLQVFSFFRFAGFGHLTAIH